MHLKLNKKHRESTEKYNGTHTDRNGIPIFKGDRVYQITPHGCLYKRTVEAFTELSTGYIYPHSQKKEDGTVGVTWFRPYETIVVIYRENGEPVLPDFDEWPLQRIE